MKSEFAAVNNKIRCSYSYSYTQNAAASSRKLSPVASPTPAATASNCNSSIVVIVTVIYSAPNQLQLYKTNCSSSSSTRRIAPATACLQNESHARSQCLIVFATATPASTVS